MNRAQASEAIGRRVRAWTAANGVYTGRLQTITARHGAPWRGVVVVDGVVAVARHFENGVFMRRGFRPGETLEVGGQNIQRTEVAGFATYEEALLAHIESVRLALERVPRGAEAEQLLSAGRGSQVALKAERARVGGGAWVLRR